MDDMQISKIESILKLKEKASFFVVNFGNIPIMTLISGFLLIFYTDVVGLEPGAVAIIFLITRIIDAFNDPILGYIIDHLPKTKWGRFRPYIVLGSMICSINYIILWLGPALAPNGKLLIAFISYIFLGITFDLMDIPLNSMIPVMSETGKDRDSLSLIKSLGYIFGSILFYGLTIPLVSSFPTPLIGYIVLIVSSSAFVFLVSTIGTLGVRERIEPISKEKYKLKELFKILSAKPVFIHFSSSLTNSISSGASVAAAIYFVTYVVKIPELVTVFVILLVIGRLIGFPLGKPILNKYGKKDTIVIGSFITNIPLFFILLVDPSNLIMIFIIYTISGIGGGFNMIVGYGLQADNTDYVEWKQGKRAEAAIASLVSFTNKAGLGIGAALVGIILALTNYVPNVDQSPLAIQGIYWAFIIVPAMLGLISGLIILFFYPLTKEMNTKIFLSLNELRHQNSEK